MASGIEQWTYLVVDTAIVGRDIVRVEEQALLQALEARHRRGHLDAAGEEAR